MKKFKIFSVLTGYQITWFACIFGEKYYPNLQIGLILGLLFYSTYFFLNKNKSRFIKISLLIAVPGYFFDNIVVYFFIYNFVSEFEFGFLPIWMISLWLSFSILFDEILIFFKKFRNLGFMLSGILGPLTYYSGTFFGIINIENITIFFILMIIFWILLMYYYLNIVLKINYLSKS